MARTIAIDAMIMAAEPCGIRECAVQICTRLAARADELRRLCGMDITVNVPRGMSGCFGPGLTYREPGGLTMWADRLRRARPYDLYHALHQLVRLHHMPPARNVLMTVHDANFAHTRTGAGRERARKRYEKRLRHATHLLFISDFARRDIHDIFDVSLPERVIYNGVTPPPVSAGAVCPAALDPSFDDSPFLFHLSSLVPYKNPHLLVSMMDSLPDKTLVLAGHRPSPELLAMVAARPNVIMVGGISDSEKNWLYSRCEAFLFPSSAEGFGLPPIEAMHHGKPVFLSTLTSLPEVGGDMAFYWPDLEPEAMARVLVDSLARPKDPAAVMARARSFSWDNTVDRLIEYYRDILQC